MVGVIDASQMPRGRPTAWEDHRITGIDHQGLGGRSDEQENPSSGEEGGDAPAKCAGGSRDADSGT